MRTVAIIQAHMGSTRLPGKVLRDIAGKTMLAHVVERTRRAKTLDLVAVACADLPTDDVLADYCRNLNVPVFRGSDSDVLSRFHGAAHAFEAETVVRITSDCPLIDPGIVDKVVGVFRETGCDYAGFCENRTYPNGLDAEVMTMQALSRADAEANQRYERVHVTPYIYHHPELFRIVEVRGEPNCGDGRWTVDTEQDLEFVKAVYERFAGRDDFDWLDILELLKREPALAEINSAIRQKSLHEC